MRPLCVSKFENIYPGVGFYIQSKHFQNENRKITTNSIGKIVCIFFTFQVELSLKMQKSGNRTNDALNRFSNI